MNIKCETCSESLDERDVLRDRIVCWKCGWKGPEVKSKSEPPKEDKDVSSSGYREEYMDLFSYPYD